MGDRERAGSVSSWEGGGEMGREVAESGQGPTQNCATHTWASGGGNLSLPHTCLGAFSFFFFFGHAMQAGGILVPQPSMEPTTFVK